MLDQNAAAAASIRVMIRKRPFFPHEEKEKEFDVVTGFEGEGQVVVHDARMKPDMQQMFMQHHGFAAHRVFDETAQNHSVYEEVSGLVQDVANGGRGCVMMYGQTGSGKTYTMTSLYHMAADHLFDVLFKQQQEGGSAAVAAQNSCSRRVTLSFVELVGENLFDMLNGQEKLDWGKGGFQEAIPMANVEIQINSAEECKAFVEHALKLRATEATGVHDASSRSHAMCQIRVEHLKEDSSNSDIPHESRPVRNTNRPDGVLTLLDLAGSEHRIDSAEHNSERRKESALINASLSALKECIRAISSGSKVVPFPQFKTNADVKEVFV